jgi:hypothetical protein
MTENDARRSLAGLGHAVKAVGIWLSRGENDLIYQASIRQSLPTGGGAVRKGMKRAIKAHADGRIPDDRAVHLITAAERETKLSGTAQLEQVRAGSERHARRRIEPPRD